jgi:ribosome-associated translation inhibitor RaiA
VRLSIASPGIDLKKGQVEEIERDLEKLDRRLEKVEEVDARLRINNGDMKGYHVVLEVDFRRSHFVAKADDKDMGRAVREAREEMLRQINDHSKRGHTSQAKGT